MRLLVPRLAAAAPVALGDANSRDANTIVVAAAATPVALGDAIVVGPTTTNMGNDDAGDTASPVALGDANGRDANTIVVASTTTNTDNDDDDDDDDAGDTAAVAIVRAKCGFRDNKGSNMQLLRRQCCQETIPILLQQKDWVGGSRKWLVLLTFSHVFMLT